MKYFPLILVVSVVLSLNSSVHAQISNLVINGSGTNFSMTSGDTIHWEFDVVAGATVDGEIWYDVNNNGSIDPATDKVRFLFTQTDGNSSGNGGPPDLDGTANGHVVFYQRVGIAPGQYIFRFTHNSASVTRTGTVSPLSSPAHAISGHITPPAGKSPQNIFVEVRRNDHYEVNSWDAITDASGDYTIHMDADTAGNPWYVRLGDQYNPFPPAIVNPTEIALTITGDHSGNNFTFTPAAAQVAGLLKDEFGAPIVDGGVSLQPNDTSHTYHDTRTNPSGFFQIGIASGELHGQSWSLRTQNNNSDVTTTQLIAQVQIPLINSNDSLYRELIVYNVNSLVSGQVTVDGHAPGFFTTIFATNNDSGQASAHVDSSTGDFTIPVSNKIENYSLSVAYLPFGWYSPTVVVHPGDTGVIFNISTSQTFYLQYNNDWNMLSVPLYVQDNQKTSLFPFALSNAFNFSAINGYTPQTFLYQGVGYWLKFGSTGIQAISGSVIAQESIAVAPGWNLIGTPTNQLPTSNVVGAGTVIQSSFFDFGLSGYSPRTTLVPGFAYWVKVSQAGTLVLTSSSAHPASQTSQEHSEILPSSDLRSVNRLIFTDARGNRRTLFFSPQPFIDGNRHELPPLPPQGIMDVRFATNNMLETSDHDGNREISLQLSSIEFPLTVRWEINDQTPSASLIINGKEIPLTKNGSARISSSDAALSMKFSSAKSQEIPKEFALHNSYPNPFNPTARIDYDIPSNVYVRLSIFNLLGQEVARLVDQDQHPGKYTATVDGSGLSSGLYFYELKAGTFTDIKKMILIK